MSPISSGRALGLQDVTRTSASDVEPTPARRRAEDGQVFEELYPSLRRFAAACGGVNVDPDDLVQEAVARTLARHHLSDIEHPGAYLRQAILNVARTTARSPATTTIEASHDPSGADFYPSDLSILDQLSPSTRAAVFLRYVDRVSLRDGAKILGCSPAALRFRAARGRMKLQRLTEGDSE